MNKLYSRILVIITCATFPLLANGSNYKKAYEEINNAPGFVQDMLCYAGFMAVSNVREAMDYYFRAKHNATGYLRAKGYDSEEIDIALFAYVQFKNGQWSSWIIEKQDGHLHKSLSYTASLCGIKIE